MPQTPQRAEESEESSRDPTVGQPPPKEGPEGGPPKVVQGGAQAHRGGPRKAEAMEVLQGGTPECTGVRRQK